MGGNPPQQQQHSHHHNNSPLTNSIDLNIYKKLQGDIGLSTEQCERYTMTLKSFLNARLTKINFEKIIKSIIPSQKMFVHNSIIYQLLQRALSSTSASTTSLPLPPTVTNKRDKLVNSNNKRISSSLDLSDVGVHPSTPKRLKKSSHHHHKHVGKIKINTNILQNHANTTDKHLPPPPPPPTASNASLAVPGPDPASIANSNANVVTTPKKRSSYQQFVPVPSPQNGFVERERERQRDATDNDLQKQQQQQQPPSYPHPYPYSYTNSYPHSQKHPNQQQQEAPLNSEIVPLLTPSLLYETHPYRAQPPPPPPAQQQHHQLQQAPIISPSFQFGYGQGYQNAYPNPYTNEPPRPMTGLPTKVIPVSHVNMGPRYERVRTQAIRPGHTMDIDMMNKVKERVCRTVEENGMGVGEVKEDAIGLLTQAIEIQAKRILEKAVLKQQSSRRACEWDSLLGDDSMMGAERLSMLML